MGEIAHVDLDQLSRLADHIGEAADRIAAASWPQLEPTVLPGSAVAAAATPQLVAHRVAALAADLYAWAAGARTAADAFARTDAANADRLGRR